MKKIIKLSIVAAVAALSLNAAELGTAVLKKVEGSLKPGSKVVLQKDLPSLGLHELHILVPGAKYKKEVVFTNKAGTFLTQSVYKVGTQEQVVPDLGYDKIDYKGLAMTTVGDGGTNEYIIVDPIFIGKSKMESILRPEIGKTKHVFYKTNMGDETSILLNIELYKPNAKAEEKVMKNIIEVDKLKKGLVSQESFTQYIYKSVENFRKTASKETLGETESYMKGVNEVIEIMLGKNKVEGGYAVLNEKLEFKNQRLPQDIDTDNGDVMKIGESVLYSVGNGPKQVFLFTDPDCPYCVKMDKAINGLGVKSEYTVNVIAFPLQGLHADALDKSRYVMAMEQGKRQHEFTRVGGNPQTVESVREAIINLSEEEIISIDKRIGAGMAIGRKLGVQGTPNLILVGGNGQAQKIEAGEVLRLRH